MIDADFGLERRYRFVVTTRVDFGVCMAMGVEVWHRALPNSDAMRLPTGSADQDDRPAAHCPLGLGTSDPVRSFDEAVIDRQSAPANDAVFSAIGEGIFLKAEQLQLDLGNAPEPVVQRWSASVRLALLLGGAVASWGLFLTVARLVG